MHSFLYPDSPDLPESPDTLHVYPDKSIGVEEVRRIQTFLSRKPLTEKNIVVIFSAHLLTLPAQHALLKILEEPPGNSLIYLITKYPDSLLPTILSRVQIFDHPDHPDFPENPEIPKLIAAGVGDRLKILDAQSFTRETLSAFLDQFEFFIHKELSSPLRLRGDKRGDIKRISELIWESRKYLKSNCNLKLILDNFALNLTS